MELRSFALRILSAETLEGKFELLPERATDLRGGPALRLPRPVRPPNLRIVPLSEARVPLREGMADPAQRARILHALANHELQALELFAWALLAFPDAPFEFRRGLTWLLEEEQAHCRMYLDRLKSFKVTLGDYPVSGYFWGKVKDFTTPLRFICGMSLTFENANLDHSVDYAESSRAVGDLETAWLLDRIHRDEVEHVRFGWHWLGQLKEEGQSMSEAYRANVTWPVRPALARGKVFHRRGRELAGLDAEFVEILSRADRDDRDEPAGIAGLEGS
jgi:uncharacterized ferritin-like protein (DUF455 family)